MNLNRYLLLVVLVILFTRWGIAQDSEISELPESPINEVAGTSGTLFDSSVPPVQPRLRSEVDSIAQPAKRAVGVDWIQLTRSTLGFLALEHGFRLLTEPQTRDNLRQNSFFSGYVDSVTNLHGFGDGDPFYVNYVGHPMQGAVSGYIWQHNDRAYRGVQFGKNRRYWKSKLRSMAFAFFYSEQFEIGPVSEASIGNIQSDRPQVGFVDHVMTPAIGMAWTIGEDWMDRDIVQRFEMHIANPYFKALIRGGLNPSRSLSNALSGKVPWHRDDRAGLFKHSEFRSRPKIDNQLEQIPIWRKGVPQFEFSVQASLQRYRTQSGSGRPCVGGLGEGGFRIAAQWQIVTQVGGCKMLDMASYFTSDMLTFMVGPRWVHQVSSHWTTHLQALFGGTKYSVEQVSPQREAQETELALSENKLPRYEAFTDVWDHTGFSVRAGGGLTVKLNNAFSMRVLDLNYTRTANGISNGLDYRSGFQFSGGFILSIGTW